MTSRIRNAEAVQRKLARRTSVAAATLVATAGVLGAGAAGASAKGLTLTLWHSTSDTAAQMNLYKAYEKESGNKIAFVNISINDFGPEVTAKWATGARPDILEWNGNPADAESIDAAKETENLTSLPFVKKEVGSAALSGKVGGKTYAATLGPLEVGGLMYNKKVFAKAGLKPPTDYADLFTDCKVLKSKDPSVTPIFEAGGTQWPAQELSFIDYTAQYEVNDAYSEQILKGKTSLTAANGPFMKGMTEYDQLRSDGCFNSNYTTATWTAQTKAVLDGSAAMIGATTENIPQIYSQANNNNAEVAASVAFVGLSATKPIGSVEPSFLGTYYVPKTGNSAKEQAAIDFIKFITSPSEYQKYVNQAQSVPTMKGAKTPTKLVALWAETAKIQASAGLAIFSAIPGMGPNLGTEASALLSAQQSPAQVAAKFEAYYQEAESALK